MLDELSATELFLQVVRAQGFTSAAKTLGKSASTLSRAVSELERHLGAPLLARTTRRLHLTEAGVVYVAHAEALLAARRAAHDAVAELTGGTPRGHLRVSMPVAVGERLLGPHLPAFRRRYPELRLELDLSDRNVELVQGGFDLAVRVGRPADSSLKAVMLGKVGVVLVASPGYLKARGTPEKPADVSDHDCIAVGTVAGPVEWTFHRRQERVTINVDGEVHTTSPTLGAQLAKSGLGLLRTIEWVVRDELERGDLVPVMPTWTAMHPLHGGVPVFALFGSSAPPPLKARVFVDLIRDIMRDEVVANAPTSRP
jgi:DNA-binding transcriptional LysR family regulator